MHSSEGTRTSQPNIKLRSGCAHRAYLYAYCSLKRRGSSLSMVGDVSCNMSGSVQEGDKQTETSAR